VNSTVLFGEGVSGLKSSIMGQIDAYTSYAGTDPTVIAGYKAIYNTTANDIITSPIGLVEVLIGNNVDGIINIGAALQHPFSTGQIYINSSNPMDYPVINPNYLSHPADIEVLLAGIKLARRLGEADPLAGNMEAEVWPGPDVQTDAEWEDWLRSNTFTEFHPSSTCAMLPLEQGGVVDANLRVYGLSNVRVADASVPPISFSAHLMGSTYGLAEQASTIIRTYHNIKPSTVHSKTTSNSTTTAAGSTPTHVSSSSSSTGTSKGTNGGNSGSSLQPWTLFIGIVVSLGARCLL